MLRAIGYIRVSTPRQGKSRLGIEAQEEALAQYCRITGTVIERVYYEVKSGRKKRKPRPELMKALKDCRENGLDLVISTQNRLARDIDLVHTLMESAVKFFSADKPHATRYDIYRQAVNDEEESEIISKRTIDALQAAKRRGVKLGTYAATLVRNMRQRSNDFTVSMIPKIEQLRALGYTTEPQILTQLRRRRIPPLRGRGYRWHASTVHYLLKRIERLKAGDPLKSQGNAISSQQMQAQ